jgi:transposase InsO family protein
MHFHNPKLQQVCEDEVGRCDPCQRHKNVGRGHGETASREASLLPWQDVAVDLIGPWTLSIGDQKFRFSASTMIDMVTNLVEVVRVTNKTSAHIALKFENTWLARYPKPANVIHDQGGEFLGFQFQRRLQLHNIRSRPTTAKTRKQTRFVNACTMQWATLFACLQLWNRRRERHRWSNSLIRPSLTQFMLHVAPITAH